LNSIELKSKENGGGDCSSAIAFDSEDNMYVLDCNKCQVMVFDSKRKYLKSFGGKGKKGGEFDYPLDMVIDQQNRIVIADSGNHRIQILTLKGEVIHSFGTDEEDPETEYGFLGVNHIAVNSRGDIISSDEYCRVRVFNKDGGFLFAFGSRDEGAIQFCEIGGLVVDRFDRIITSDFEYSELQFFEDDGSLIHKIKDFPFELIPKEMKINGKDQILILNAADTSISVLTPPSQ